MLKIGQKLDRRVWTRSLITFAIVVFLVRFGQGLLGGARMVFFVDTLDLDGNQVLWLEGIRELPGLALIVLAVLTMRMPIKRQAALSVALMGVGYALFAFIGSYAALLAAAVVASFGFHLWTPLNSAIGMSLSSKESAGRVLGALGSVGSLAAIAGMGGLALISWLYDSMPLQYYYLVGGIVIVLGAIFLLQLPNDLGTTKAKPARIVVKKRYWLYYVLIFFSGASKLVLGSFVTLMLVDRFDFKVWQVSTLMLVSGVLNLVIGPYRGSLIDRFGERITTPLAYGILAFCCMGYAAVPLLGLSDVQSLWILISFWILIKLAQPLGQGLSTYVYRTAPAEELTPTLTAGVTFDHISSVSMPFLYGALLPVIQYEGIFFALAILILVSIPFARALQVRAPVVVQPVPSGAE